MAKKYIKTCSMQLYIKKIQIKTTVRLKKNSQQLIFQNSQ